MVLALILAAPFFLLPDSAIPYMGRYLILADRAHSGFTSYTVRGDRLWLDPTMASHLERLDRFARDHLSEDEAVLIVPFSPGVYPALDLTFPLWDSYPLFPEDEITQAQEIERLEDRKVRWALIYDTPFMGREDLRYSRTHAKIYEHILDTFKPVMGHPLHGYQLFHRSEASTPAEATENSDEDGS